MSAVTAMSGPPMCPKEQVVFYRRKWKGSQVNIETKNERIEQLVNKLAEVNNQVTELNKAIKYLL